MDSRPKLDTLQGLLRFAVEHTKSEDALKKSEFENMDPDRKKFLENAMKSINVNLIEELEKAIHILESETSSNDEKLKALEMVSELACDLDLSNNFLQIGGSRIVMKSLTSNDPRMRSAASALLAEIVQNNTFGQKHFTDLLVIPKLIKLLQDSQYADVVRNSLHATSCLVREYEPALAIFIDKNGLENLLKCLQSNDDRTVTKASFLISIICSEFPATRDEFIKLLAIEKLCKSCQNIDIDGNYDAKLENILSALNALTNEYEAGKESFKTNKNINFNTTLQKILEVNKNSDECEEIVMYTNNLSNILQT